MRASDDGGFVPVHLTALDVPIVVRSFGNGAAALADDIRNAWSWCLSVPFVGLSAEQVVIDVLVDSRAAVVAEAGGRGVLAGTEPDTVLHDLAPTVTMRAITLQASALFMVHACGVADPVTGRTVAMVGPSGAGKTTMATTLCREFAYVSDETVALRPDDTVVPYPKPLSVLGDGGVVKSQVSPDFYGFQRPPEPCSLAKMLFLDRRADGPRTPYLEPVDTVRALAELAPQISFLARQPQPLRRLAATLHATGGLHRVRYREAEDLLPVVEGLVQG